MAKIRVSLILLALLLPAAYWVFVLAEVRSTYATSKSECPSAAATPSASTELPVVVGTVQKQSEVLLNWSLALASGVVAFIATPTLHPFRYMHFVHLLLAPALSFLGGSIYAALLLLRRMTYLQLAGCKLPTASINSFLANQTDFLTYAVALLAAFAAWCLIEIALGWVKFGNHAS